MYILGVTGNIGSGKTTVSQRLAEFGAVVSHSDDLAKEILQNTPEIISQICTRFGADILDESGSVQTRLLAERAFSSPGNQKFLNGLIHPEVRKATLARIQTARESACRLFVIDAPLLFEAGVDAITDSVLVVTASHIFRQGRVEKRSQIRDNDFNRRDELQLSIEEKIARADHVITNNGSLDDLMEKVDALYRQLML
ncbi:MAG: dephospho-CoA kinase [Candidatus Marinimicrobia bacterium]|nr:dephospho-CoA kinase [Candidatus Neomarinimicrobiota bacterium]